MKSWIKKASDIRLCNFDTAYTDKSGWPQHHAWHHETLEMFDRVFREWVAALDASDVLLEQAEDAVNFELRDAEDSVDSALSSQS